MKKVGIFYGSSSGDTEAVAKKIQEALGGDDGAEVIDIIMARKEDLERFDNLILGTSTWRGADLQSDWKFYLDMLDESDLSGKKVALFGLGDSRNYPANFVDAMKVLYDKVLKSKGTIVGATSTKDYTYKKSRAEVDGKFVGLPVDEDNEYEKTPHRIEQWCEQLKKAFL